MSFGETAIIPTGRLGHLNRTVGLISRAEGRIRRRFLRSIRDTNALVDLDTIAGFLDAGDIDSALALYDEIGGQVATAIDQAYVASGLQGAEFLRSRVDTLFDFNSTNFRAVNAMQQTRGRLIREMTIGQRQATQRILQDGVRRGLAPVAQARQLQGSIGLTQHQAGQVNNFRSLLERNSSQALTRTLRDRRFDTSIRRAVRTGTPLTAAQIDRQVARYQTRFIRKRAKDIATTEAVAAVSAADMEVFEQAVESGVVAAEDVQQRWRISGRNTRPSHRSMNGQTRPLGQPFKSGNGNALRFPGDPQAPAADRVNCHCVVVRTLAADVRTRPALRPAA